jgi:hypothetical protein
MVIMAKRKGLRFDNKENYYPMIIRTAGNKDWITEEVTKFYEGMEGDIKKSGQVVGGGISGVGPNISVTIPQPYIPEFASPDRLFFPSNIKEAMKYWRFFYALDPVCGNIIDMYAEMMLSDAELAGESLDDEIRGQYYKALEDTQALGQFRWLIVGYMVDGEVVPHLVWNDDEQRWVYLGFQDPMNITVEDVPFIGVEPYLELQIPEKVRELLTNPDLKYEKFRKNVPKEFLDLVMMGRDIPLNTEENVTFIPRKLNPYDVRGVSLFSRIWRVLLLEDSIFNATIATARRHASPVKVIKQGNPATGWIPGPEQEDKLRTLLAIAETDPHAWLLTHFAVNFEAWGTTDRVMTINKHWEVIERIKLIAFGVSKAFLTGEVTYASSYIDSSITMADKSSRNIGEVKIGNKVVDRLGDIKKVTDVLVYPSPDEMVEINLEDGKSLTITDNHKLPVGENGLKIRADGITNVDYLYSPLESKFIKVKSVRKVKVDKKKNPKVYSLTVEGTESYILDGVASYNSAEKGLQIFLARLNGMRTFFENKWWYPRFFKIMAEKNDWVQPTEAEVNHRVRTRRTAREIAKDGRYIIPKMVWSKSLDPQSKSELVRLYQEISERFGIKVSRTEVSATVGLDWEEQERKWREEEEVIKKLNEEFDMGEKPPAEEDLEGVGVGGFPGGGPPPPPDMEEEIASGEEAPPEEIPEGEAPAETPEVEV